MTALLRPRLASLVVLLAARSAFGQGLMAPHPLGRIVAQTSEPLGSVTAIRVLSTGQVLVSDAQDHRLLLLDSLLQHPVAVADSGGAAARRYGKGPGTLFALPGDTTLFFDATSYGFLLVDPAGSIGRVIAVPRPADLLDLTNAAYGKPAIDSHGRLFYALAPRGPSPSASAADVPDLAPIVRADLVTRVQDTLAYQKIARTTAPAVVRDSTGQVAGLRQTINPLPVGDDWTLAADGSLAVIRAHDYHVDWVRADGSHDKSPPLPYEWLRLTDSDKVQLVDSVKAATAARAKAQAAMAQRTGAPASSQTTPDVLAPADLPDYRPPFRGHTAIPDAVGNVWLRTTRPLDTAGGTVYDVVSNHGVLIDRIEIQKGFALVGFDPHHAYMTIREGSSIILVKTLLR